MSSLHALGPSSPFQVSQEAFHDALYFKDEALRAFKLGILSLEERAQVIWRLLTYCDLPDTPCGLPDHGI